MISKPSWWAAQGGRQDLRLFGSRFPQAIDHAALVAGDLPHGVDVGIAGTEAAVHSDTTCKVNDQWILLKYANGSKFVLFHQKLNTEIFTKNSGLPRSPSSSCAFLANSSRGRMPQEMINRSTSRKVSTASLWETMGGYNFWIMGSRSFWKPWGVIIVVL